MSVKIPVKVSSSRDSIRSQCVSKHKYYLGSRGERERERERERESMKKLVHSQYTCSTIKVHTANSLRYHRQSNVFWRECIHH